MMCDLTNKERAHFEWSELIFFIQKRRKNYLKYSVYLREINLNYVF